MTYGFFLLTFLYPIFGTSKVYPILSVLDIGCFADHHLTCRDRWDERQAFHCGKSSSIRSQSPLDSRTNDGEKVIHDFRKLVQRRLDEIGVAVLDVRMEGGETKSLGGSASLGSPGKWVIKRTVQQIKELAQEFFQGDPELLRSVERAMADESETVEKRLRTVKARRVVGV